MDRVPEKEDGDSDGEVRIPRRFGVGHTWVSWKYVHIGTPWSRTGAEPGPWRPTTLDRNGWIRSRLPTVWDASQGSCWVKVPSILGPFIFQNYTLIVPGQAWAPWSVTPGPYQP